MSRKESRTGSGNRRVTTSDGRGNSTDMTLNKNNSRVTSIVDHDKNGKSHSHEPLHGIFGVSKGEQKSDSKGGGSSSGGGSSGGGGGLCYLTTACTEVMGLPDSCFELQILRRFRDEVLLPTSVGKRAVKDYYSLAPDIVQRVDERNNADLVWRSVYQQIQQIVAIVLSGDFNAAFEHYRQMTLSLKQRYL